MRRSTPISAEHGLDRDHAGEDTTADVEVLKNRLQKVENLLARSKAREFEARDRQRSAEKKIEKERIALEKDKDTASASHEKELERLRGREAELVSQIEAMKLEAPRGPFGESPDERRLIEKIISELGATLQTLDEMHSPNVSKLKEAYDAIASDMGLAK